MKERPILFSADMVTAILEGRKTQTRRVAKEFPPHVEDSQILNRFPNQKGCPYGDAGDRLWVRETWQPFRDRTPEQQAQIKAWFDKADHSNFMNEVDQWSPMPDGQMQAMYAADFGDWAYDVNSDLKPWKPSIFMPRWASRIDLEITSVRVERLQDISEEDAKAEGVGSEDYVNKVDSKILPTAKLLGLPYEEDRVWFAHLWNEINGKKYPWESNPYVWVIAFEKVKDASPTKATNAP